MKTKEYWIDKLHLQPLDGEGGYFRRIKRDSRTVENRNYYTTIYYLLEDRFKCWIKLRQDEIWNVHSGSAVTVHMISPDGEYSNAVLGRDIEKGELLSFSIPHDHYYFIEVNDQNINYCLATCTVVLGFDYRDRECIADEDLIIKYPGQRKIIYNLRIER